MPEHIDTIVSADAPSPTRVWHDRLQELERRQDEFDSFYREVCEPLNEAFAKRFPTPFADEATRQTDIAWSEKFGHCAANQESEEMMERVTAIRDELMTSPAPDKAALCWKLDALFLDDGGSMFPWTLEDVAQAQRDYRRILGQQIEPAGA